MVVLEHLSDQLYVHILDIDLLYQENQSPNVWMGLGAPVTNLEALVHHHDCFVKLFNVGNDTGKQ